MAKIPQQQFINVMERIKQDRKDEPSIVSSGDNFGKSWHISGAYGIEASDGRTLDRYRLSHYGTCVLQLSVYSDGAVVIKEVKVTSASDRDGINSLLYLLDAGQRVNIHGELR